MHLPSRPQQVLLIHHRTSGTIRLPFPLGVTVEAGFFSVNTKQLLREGPFSLPGPITIHLAPARKFHPDWCYLQLWNARDGQFECTCREGTTLNYCQHIHDLECVAV